MTRLPVILILAVLSLGQVARADAAPPSRFQAREVIADILVHGNQIATNEAVVRLSGVKIGDPLDAQTIGQIAARLQATHRFEKVEVLKRFASLSDPSQIVIVLIVDEGPVTITAARTPGGETTVKRRSGVNNLMFLPILYSEDGYGFTYGARFAFPKVGGSQGRLSFPVSWGGDRQAGAEFEKGLKSRVITRVEFGGGLFERTNPFYETDDTRRRAWARAERTAGPVRFGATGGWQHVEFQGTTDSFRSLGVDATLDTRLDPFLARNAVLASVTADRLWFAGGASVDRQRYDARGFVGFIGQSVIVLRAVREVSSAPLPPYLKPLLGGVTNLRGFDAGMAAGDTLAAGSAELRVPLTSPLNIGKLGVSAFVDTGATCSFGQRLRDQERKVGAGGAVWVTAAVVRVLFFVAHGVGAGTKAQFDLFFGF